FYKTCVSHKRKGRRSSKKPRYICTVCKEGLIDKTDWKRHEETCQERPESFECDLCNAVYFLNKDFKKHHAAAHLCNRCTSRDSRKEHAERARRLRRTRSGWGCGFCYHFSDKWTERCNHVASHFDKMGTTIADWNHSAVIYSLLQRPAVRAEWDAVLRESGQKFLAIDWDPQTTGRTEGYPDIDSTPKLQDMLEFLVPSGDAKTLAQMAFDQAVKKVTK
ncbi:hypothetical protein EK21DRAFT_44093, partial [Setomelanomma holmii]